MNFETILVRKENRIAVVTLNRPHALNAVVPQMFEDLKVALQDINDDDTVGVMVLTGAGKAFCASADIKVEAGESGRRLLADYSIEEVRRRFARNGAQAVVRGIINMEKPTIAMVNGLAIGDGFDWCLACDIRVGSDKARFMYAYIKMAMLGATGATWLCPRVMPLGKAFEILYTGDWLEAEEAYRSGLLTRLVPSARLEQETMALAGKLAQGPPIALRHIKTQMYKGLEIGLDAALEYAADGELITMTTKDHIEAVSAWLEKRQPKFTGQ